MPHKDPAERRAYQSRWREEHRATINAYHRQWFKEHWDSSEAFREANKPRISKQAHSAHQRVQNAIKRGELVRPTHCPECGRETFVEAAHENYTERLAVRWLCRPCHRRWDQAHPKAAAAEPSVRASFVRPSSVREFVCAQCGQSFQATPHSRRRTPTPCCSKSCGQKLVAERKQVTSDVGWWTCDCCGERFYRAPGKVKATTVFCGYQCSARYRWAQRRAGKEVQP